MAFLVSSVSCDTITTTIGQAFSQENGENGGRMTIFGCFSAFICLVTENKHRENGQSLSGSEHTKMLL